MRVPSRVKSWSNNDLLKLRICYEAKIPIHVMGEIFNKSPNSINKLLTRKNIRPPGRYVRGARPSDMRSPFTTLESALQLFKELEELAQGPADLEKNFTSYLVQVQTRYPQFSATKIARSKPQEMWVSREQIVAELSAQGHSIEYIKKQVLLQQGYAFLLNGCPKTLSHLLALANTERVARKLPRIFIEGLTTD